MSHSLSLIATLALFATSASNAAVVLSNLSESSDTFMNFGMFRFGAGFTTGSGASQWQLDSVTLQMENAGSNLLIELRQEAAPMTPGAVITTFIGSIPTVRNDYTFTPAASTTLTANTRYYITASSSAGNWLIATSNNESGAQGWSVEDFLLLGNGTDWSAFARDGGGAQKIAVSATAVPEPSSFAAVLVAAGCLGFRRNRLRQG